jgi:uncharacterized protein YfaS (alpha-2-macroglobulin family)
MKPAAPVLRATRLRLALFAALLALALTQWKVIRPILAADGEDASATYSRGVLHATIPYQLPHPGAGRLVVEILNPEDGVLGSMDRDLDAPAKGQWQADIPVMDAPALADLACNRLRYHFTYSGQKDAALSGADSLSEIVRMPVLHIFGAQSYLSGAQAAVRVVVTDAKGDPVAGPGAVRIELAPQSGGKGAGVLFTGQLNRRGTAEAQFRIPAGAAGVMSLRYAVDTPIGSTEFTQQVRVEDKVSILLTTEKPIYQPGQTIHARALALDRADHQAAAGRKLTFEVADSKGNKVFRKATQTDRYGVASADFTLADEVNLGPYHLRALMDGPGANTGELALTVDKYVLPKFKVAVDFADADAKAKRGYRPGDHVTGTVRANYFFGKAVDDGEVTVKATGMDVAQFEAGRAEGKTDADGAYKFDIHLPAYFAGRPLSQGAARVLIEATVKDSAGHSETRGEPITVSVSPLTITAVPESGALVPGLENQVFLLAAYPDGSPAVANVSVHAEGNPDRGVTTDESGVAVVPVRAETGMKTLRIDASDKEGNHASTSVDLQSRTGEEQILLRTDRAVYRAGDRIDLKVLSTRQRGAAYIDVVREGQTVLTRDVDLANGQAELAIAATPELAGTLDFDAYLFGANSRPVADHRLAFVQPANELKIETTADAPEYLPGAEARINFRVTDAQGQGVEAALGVQVVDEAVFALAEKQPGFAKVFFYLEQEVMKPRYEIHSIGMPALVTSAAAPQPLAERALFAATEMVNNNRFETETGAGVPRDKYNDYAARYKARFMMQMDRLAQVLNAAYRENPGLNIVDYAAGMAAAHAPEMRDAWEGNVRVESDRRWTYRGPNSTWVPVYTVRSAGPDKRFDTADDMMAFLEAGARSASATPTTETGGTARVEMEHGRGPVNGLAQIDGTLADTSGAAIPGAQIAARLLPSGQTRNTVSGPEGVFVLNSIPPGRWEIRATSPGFKTFAEEVNVQARDRALLTVTMALGALTEEISVTAAATPVQTASGQRNFVVDGIADMAAAGGARGGAAGGFGGGNVENLTLKGRDLFAQLAPVPGVAFGNTRLTGGNATSESGALGGLQINNGAAPPHVRSYFPEALYINPEIVTDGAGMASISVPLADSITTWRMALVASTPHGALGSGASSVKVFQDFFIEPDLPVTLTQGDQVSIPVAVYNYSGSKGNVSVQLQSGDWFTLADDTGSKTVSVDSGRVGAAQFTIRAAHIGKFKLTLNARMDGAAGRADIVVREIEVVPNGREQNMVFNGRLDSAVEHQVNFPASAVPEASKIFVRLYPGPLSQVIEGMDSLLRMPFGCFEQTSSATYPNVLALDYMKRTGKLTPEAHAKAEGFISTGYQRLLTFEVPGGGFSWFGQAPANKILTGYGLMEFYDMSQVYDVDANVIHRTQAWLASQQQADGSWRPDASFINEGATDRFNTGAVRIAAYLGWSLESTGYRGQAVERARQFVEQHLSDAEDAYTKAVIANFAVDYGKDAGFTDRAMQQLLDARTERDGEAWWTAEETGVYGRGPSAAIETTGLAAQALLKWWQAPATVSKAMKYIAAKKDANGTWGTTQATIMALRALLLATSKSASDVRGSVEITVDGKTVETLNLNAENNDLLHQFTLPATQSANTVGMRFSGSGALAYQVVGRYFLPWTESPANEPLSIDVSYDRTHLAQDDIATATATVRNGLPGAANMVMVDLGIPPGFDLLTEDLQDMQGKRAGARSGRLEKFNVTATQAILYFDSIAPGDTLKLKFRLRAKYPIRAQTFPSQAYEYYSPEVNSVARPVKLEVAAR